MAGKIIIVGANQCALAFAYMAAKKGFDVVAYEKEKKEDVAFPWTDDVATNAFDEAGLPLPPEEIRWHTNSPTFVIPNKTVIPIELPEENLDYSVLRRPMNDWLEKMALEAGAKVVYEKTIDHAITLGDKVIGVVFTDGEVETSDLVVDCGGMNSCVRSSLPDCFGILKTVDPEDYFFVKRVFFDRPEDAPDPEYIWKIYLKHLGERGISWCHLSHDKKYGDVLIGRTGGLSEETYQRALDDIRSENPIVGETFIPETNILCKIPVRHTLSKIFSDGYVLLGDSACMTIPLIGSGIASGFKAARNLAETLETADGDPFSAKNLYRYQYRYMRETGAFHAIVDVLKNALLDTDAEIINIIANPETVASVMKAVAGQTGDFVKAVIGLAKDEPKIFAGILSRAAAAGKAGAVTLTIPKEYDEKKFAAWRKKYEKATNER